MKGYSGSTYSHPISAVIAEYYYLKVILIMIVYVVCNHLEGFKPVKYILELINL